MNNCTFTGRLTRDPELRYSKDNLAICTFSIAVQRESNTRLADFIDITAMGAQGENCAKYLCKGRLVGIKGRLQNNNYEKDGRTIKKDVIMADRVEFLESKTAQTENTAAPNPKVTDYQTAKNSWQMPIDDIPF